MKKRTITIGATGAAVALAATGTGVALGLGSSAQASPAVSTGQVATSFSANGANPFGPARRELRRAFRQLVRHSIHAEFLVKTASGYMTVDIDRGHVLTFSSGAITITRPDGTEISADITSSTKFFGLKESDIGKGDRAIVVQSGGDALDVLAAPPRTSSATSAAA